MAAGIISQPTSDTIVAAYRPILFLLLCNQQPANANPSPALMADIYFDDVYYASIFVTDYEKVSAGIVTFYYYTIDIQDKAQEYLRSSFARMYENTFGDMEDVTQKELFSTKCQVKFREGYIDTNGFTQFYGTAPVQGTKYTAPISGTGTVTSDVFYILNATLRDTDNPDLTLHLFEYQDPFQQTYGLSHRPNYLENVKLKIGGGRYYICKDDNDFIFCFSNAYYPNVSDEWYVALIAKYKNGTSVTLSSTAYLYPTTSTTATPYKVYSFNAGIPNLRNVFGSVQWDNVVEYEIFVSGLLFQAMRQKYYVSQCGCCEEHDRIFFLNNMGTFDGINFYNKIEINKTESGQWQKRPPVDFNNTGSKSFHSISRMQVTQNDFYEVRCNCYAEEDMEWIKELLGTPRAYIHWKGSQQQSPGLIPIKIEDGEVETIKNDGRYEYVITIRYSLSKERINLRS